ncbi:hypothetical protein FACS189451_01840 [Bacteroidia bacterium]|nr:hypothetical protein FACS189446_5790 [Bacteroidia bacterium]GHT60899.1 hypothetical protein FACS189451_01840 [Bacteroidia bacterium]
MKHFIFFLTFVFIFLSVKAQNYNIQGDLALEKKDYQNARTWYSEGLVSCDLYSIRKLTDIWKEQPGMRASMRLSMQKCYTCLKPLAEQQDQEAMLLISEYFKSGIGTGIDSVKGEYWLKEYGKSLGLSVDVPAIDTVRITEPVVLNPPVNPVKIPKKSILSNRFYSFLAYTYSRFEPVGGTIGFFDKFGFYLSYRTDLNRDDYDYSCNNTDVPEIGIENPRYEFAGERWKCSMVTGGVFIPVYDRKFFVSVGGGRAERLYFREIVSVSGQPFGKNGRESAWCYNTEATYKGWTAELGGMWKWKRLIVFGGLNSTKLRDWDGFLSIGYGF